MVVFSVAMVLAYLWSSSQAIAQSVESLHQMTKPPVTAYITQFLQYSKSTRTHWASLEVNGVQRLHFLNEANGRFVPIGPSWSQPVGLALSPAGIPWAYQRGTDSESENTHLWRIDPTTGTSTQQTITGHASIDYGNGLNSLAFSSEEDVIFTSVTSTSTDPISRTIAFFHFSTTTQTTRPLPELTALASSSTHFLDSIHGVIPISDSEVLIHTLWNVFRYNLGTSEAEHAIPPIDSGSTYSSYVYSPALRSFWIVENRQSSDGSIQFHFYDVETSEYRLYGELLPSQEDTFSLTISSGGGMSLDQSGDLWVPTIDGRILRVDPETRTKTTQSTFPSGLGWPNPLFDDGNGATFQMCNIGYGGRDLSGQIAEYNMETNTSRLLFDKMQPAEFDHGYGLLAGLTPTDDDQWMGMARFHHAHAGRIFTFDTKHRHFQWRGVGAEPAPGESVEGNSNGFTKMGDGSYWTTTTSDGTPAGGSIAALSDIDSDLENRYLFDSTDAGALSHPQGGLEIDDQGRLWGLCAEGGPTGHGGFFRFDPITSDLLPFPIPENFHSVTLEASPLKASATAMDGSGHIWASFKRTSEMGTLLLIRLDPSSGVMAPFEIPEVVGHPTELARSPTGDLWFGVQANAGHGPSLILLPHGQSTLIRAIDLKNHPSLTEVTNILSPPFFHSDGSTYVLTNSKKLVRFDPTDLIIRNVVTNAKLPTSSVQFQLDSDHNLCWISNTQFPGTEQEFLRWPIGAQTWTTTVRNARTSSTTLLGSVNPNEGGETTVWFELDTDAEFNSPWATATATLPNGTRSTEVSISTEGLTSGKTYHYRTAAINSGNYKPKHGVIRQFKTSPMTETFSEWQRRNADNSPYTASDPNDIYELRSLTCFAFGLDPFISSSGLLSWNNDQVTDRGFPNVKAGSQPFGVDYRALFLRRKNAAVIGLTYRVEFTGDLISWQSSQVTPTVLADDGEMEMVSVPYPWFVAGRKARFTRVVVDLAP